MANEILLFNDLYARAFVVGNVDDECVEDLVSEMFYLIENYDLDVSGVQMDMLELAREELF